MNRWGWAALASLGVATLLVSGALVRTARGADTTTFVGVFPQNMPSITALVQRTQNRLVVLADFCAYGHYSNPAGYVDYRKALAEVRHRGQEVELHIYDEGTADAMTISQFGLSKTPEEMEWAFASERTTQRYSAYFLYQRARGRQSAEPTNAVQFADLMRGAQRACIEELRAVGISVKQDITAPLPLFMWIRDDEEAILSVYNLGPSSREVSMLTRDRGLLNLLNDIARRH